MVLYANRVNKHDYRMGTNRQGSRWLHGMGWDYLQ